MYHIEFESPIGTIHIATDGEYLRALAIGEHWNNLKNRFDSIEKKEHHILSRTKEQIDEYFAHNRTSFDLPLHFEGTKFQLLAWNALLRVPYGETRSYEEQAISISNPKAVRAIGRANGLNPISIIVPCHRIIGKSGKLTGFASGIENKQYLLNLENR